jgi:hypothetical protein
MGYNLLIQKLIPEPCNALDHHPLAYLAGSFFPFKAGKINWLKGGKFNPLTGITFGIQICKVMAGGCKGLLVGNHGPFSDFYTLKG